MFIRNKKMKDGRKYYVLEHKTKIKGRFITKNLRYLGTAQNLLSDLKELDELRSK